MAAGCLTAFRVGNRVVRMTAVLGIICWSLATLAEWATGLRAEPVIVADIVFGIGLLLLAASFNSRWLWIMTLIQAVLLTVHAWFYGVSETPGAKLVVANNLLSTASLVVLVVAAFRSRQQVAIPGGRTDRPD